VKTLSDKKDATSPRKIVFLILNRYFKTKKSLKVIINSCLEEYSLSGLDRRFIFNLVKGTVRYFLKIDFLLSLFSDKKIKDIDFKVLNILRMGAYQLMYMDRVPSYSAVDECVKLTAKEISRASSKFVNAVLRRVSAVPDPELLVEEKLNSSAWSDAEKISLNYSYPVWLVSYWLGWYGREKTVLICRSLNKNPHFYLRFDKNRMPKKLLAKKIKTEQAGRTLVAGDIMGGAAEVSSVQDIQGTDLYGEGLITVQDLSSQIAVRYFLDPRKNEKVLDLCAAPGGKTAYIAELVGTGGEVFAVDINSKRLEVLKSNLNRLRLENVKILRADAEKPDFLHGSRFMESGKQPGRKALPEDFEGYFDRIFIDAPCSAFGTISKDPDVKYNKTMGDIKRLSRISYRMMVNCGRYLRDGGRIIFYTCTLSPLENQKVIEKFLENFKNSYDHEIPERFGSLLSDPGIREDKAGLKGKSFFEIMPYYFKSEGGFVSSIIKKESYL
jgi:16S rRNA (cytosine967-C5)-methyltransferase